MQMGSLVKLTCPPETAFGSEGNGNSVLPDTTLIFEIEVIDHDHAPPAPKLTFRVEKHNEGFGRHVPCGVNVTFHSVSKFHDGTLLESTYDTKKPIVF